MRWKVLLAIAVLIAISLGGATLVEKMHFVSIRPDSVKVFGDVDDEPSRLYHKVWQLIKDEYYDQSYSGQNWSRWENRYDGKLKTIDDAHKAIETMLASLGDRYTRFLDKEEFSEEKSQIDAHLYGIGVHIGLDHKANRVVVITPIEGTPAEIAGLLPGDLIMEIDGKSTAGWSVDEAAKNIKGPKGTKVTLLVLRGKDEKKLNITRDEIPIKAVETAKMLDKDIGYVRLSSFISQQATSEVKDALTKLAPAKGIILDLRNNPGGLLNNAIDISNLFLDGGNIVSTVDKDGYRTPAMSDGRPTYHKPLIVMINDGSASASEITSGALRDNGRATLVGQKSFGKGLVQGINKLEDGSGVNITIARYLTPNDTDINKKGIVPDVVVELTDKDYHQGRGPWWIALDLVNNKRKPEDLTDIQLKKASEVLHKKIDASSTVAASVVDDSQIKR